MSTRYKALITGAARGIGLAVAKQLAHTYDLILVDVDKDALTQACKDPVLAASSPLCCTGNLGDPAQREQIWQDACIDGAPVILVNNAGITRDALVHKMEEKAFREVISVNLLASIHLTELALPAMTEAGFGRVVYLSSRAYLGNVGQANYATSKGGVVGYARSMALRHGAKGITFNCVAPGLIQTRLTDAIPDEIRQKFVDAIPVARIGQPEDIAAEVCWLCAADAGFVTGQVRHVCGGRSFAGPIKN